MLITKTDRAKKHGFSGAYVSKLIKTGRVVLKGELIDEEASDEILEATSNYMPMKKSNFEIKDDDNLSTALLKARIKTEIERARLLEIKVKVESGKYVAISDVQKTAFKKSRIVRDALFNIPDRVAFEFSAIKDPKIIRKRLTEEITNVLESFNDDK